MVEHIDICSISMHGLHCFICLITFVYLVMQRAEFPFYAIIDVLDNSIILDVNFFSMHRDSSICNGGKCT